MECLALGVKVQPKGQNIEHFVSQKENMNPFKIWDCQPTSKIAGFSG